MSAKVSICVPVYNVEKYIARCARSLLGQTMAADCEFIFVEDCSKDKTLSVLREVVAEYFQLKSQVRIVCHEKNQGSAKTRNDAARLATGDFVLQVDSDDWMEPDMIERLYEVAVESNADLACSEIYLEWGNGARETIHFPSDVGNTCDTYNHFDFGILYSSLWNKLIRRELLMQD